MTYEVVLSQTAVETYEAIYEQIKHKFGQSAADKFEVKVFQILDLLIDTPFISNQLWRMWQFEKVWYILTAPFFIT